jgi:hypothetical protein
MKLVLVTGAGASRDLGLEGKMPLMPDWANRLCDALDDQEGGLAVAAGLARDMSGTKFENALGTLLRWRELHPLNERFRGLGGPNAGSWTDQIPGHYEREAERLRTIVTTLNHSMYREFGSRRVDSDSAQRAYKTLFDRLQIERPLACVTTNYDPVLEMILPELGFNFDLGFHERPARSAVLRPHGLVDRALQSDQSVPVIHLHGAVGWYERDGDVLSQPPDQEYNATLGQPAVLYPDPEKDPTRDAVVQALWEEFQVAMEAGTHVLVLGHSLNDPALVDKLRRAPGCQVAVCVYAHDDPQQQEVEYGRVRELVPQATVVPCRFGPDPEFTDDALVDWMTSADPTLTS